MADHLLVIARDPEGHAALLVAPAHNSRIRAEMGAAVGEREFPLGRVLLIGETRLSMHPVGEHAAAGALVALLPFDAGRPRRPLLFDDPVAALVALSHEQAAGRRVEGMQLLRSVSVGDLFAAMGRPIEPPRLPALPPEPIDEGAIDPNAWCDRCGDHRLRRDREAVARSLVDESPICDPCALLEGVRLQWLARLAGLARDDAAR